LHFTSIEKSASVLLVAIIGKPPAALIFRLKAIQNDALFLGGLVGALDRHAETIYQDLATREQGDWVRRVMLRLVRTGEGMRDTRQRRLKVELMEMGADKATREKIEDAIDRLVDGRLLTIDRVNIEISRSIECIAVRTV
jgi:hypothetical protein